LVKLLSNPESLSLIPQTSLRRGRNFDRTSRLANLWISALMMDSILAIRASFYASLDFGRDYMKLEMVSQGSSEKAVPEKS